MIQQEEVRNNEKGKDEVRSRAEGRKKKESCRNPWRGGELGFKKQPSAQPVKPLV